MMKNIKEEIKNSLKNGGEDRQKIEEINKSLKEILPPKQAKIIKQVKETVSDLKTEIGVIKKTQSEGILYMENLGK